MCYCIIFASIKRNLLFIWLYGGINSTKQFFEFFEIFNGENTIFHKVLKNGLVSEKHFFIFRGLMIKITTFFQASFTEFPILWKEQFFRIHAFPIYLHSFLYLIIISLLMSTLLLVFYYEWYYDIMIAVRSAVPYILCLWSSTFLPSLLALACVRSFIHNVFCFILPQTDDGRVRGRGLRAFHCLVLV